MARSTGCSVVKTMPKIEKTWWILRKGLPNDCATPIRKGVNIVVKANAKYPYRANRRTNSFVESFHGVNNVNPVETTNNTTIATIKNHPCFLIGIVNEHVFQLKKPSSLKDTTKGNLEEPFLESRMRRALDRFGAHFHQFTSLALSARHLTPHPNVYSNAQPSTLILSLTSTHSARAQLGTERL